MRLLPCGETGLLVELVDLAAVRHLHAAVRAAAPAGLLEVVAAARTLLLTADTPATVRRLRALLPRLELSTPPPLTTELIVCATVYDGPDLAHVAEQTGLSPEALIAWHGGQDWTAAFGGFAPGFMYLSPDRPGPVIPRRATPRTTVPAGSVALGGEFSAVYPGPSPGGWALVGRTDAVLWDPARARPALIQPGDRVRFRPVRELLRRPARVTAGVTLTALGATATAPGVTVTAPGAPEPVEPAGRPAGLPQGGLRVLAAGPLTTVQDLGRPGQAHLGVTASGALDRAALRRANRLVGNQGVPRLAGAAAASPELAGLEVVLGGLRLQAVGPQVLAVAGAGVELLLTDDRGQHRSVPLNAPFLLPDSHLLTLQATGGSEHFRSYLAVRGGVNVPAVFGSRSSDLLSGLGPAPLRPGEILPTGRPPSASVGWPELGPPGPTTGTVLRFLPGPRADWVAEESLAAFERQHWQVSTASNRVGLRLTGPALHRAPAFAGVELPSEGLVAGAVQVPPSGQPILFLADHPVTGGYPVLGVVLAADLDRAAQLAPGSRVTFHRVTV